MSNPIANPVIAQCKSFAGKMPAFYASIIVAMLAQTIVFSGTAPLILAVVTPIAIGLVALVRMVWWIRRRSHPFSEAEARSSLAGAKIILIVSTSVILAVNIITFQYADEHGRLFLLVQMVASAMTGVYCLMHLRSTAYVMVGAMLLFVFCALHVLPMTAALGIGLVALSASGAMIVAMRGYYRDFVDLISARNAADALSEENVRLANIDMLTGLSNRRQFFVDLNRSCEEAIARGGRIAVAIADLDGFKPINDTHGHVTGDRVLAIVGERVAAAKPFRAYRLGGDEFALICEVGLDEIGLLMASEALIADIGRPIALGELIVATGCSIGVATFPDLAATPETLYERADYALYHAKRSGRNRALVFTLEHEKQLRAQGEIEQAMRSAEIESEFHLVYQPIVRPTDGSALGFECLARWRSPSLGDVPPASFIPIAEQSGLIAVLTPHLLRKALVQAASWPDGLRVSFNLSAHDIASVERTLAIIGIIGLSGVSPRRIDLELTESAVLQNFEQVHANMTRLKAIGVNISLDDFGTGYSSLSHVHLLPLDKIKIDRSFVRGMAESGSGKTIVGSIMTLCRDLNLDCVVEGVETAEQLDTLSGMGCDQAQGYLFARPMPPDQISAFLSENSVAAA